MIFVVLGTWEMPFVRPLREIDQAIGDGSLTERVVVQCGKTSFASKRMEMVPFFSQPDLEAMYDQASFVICQAGVGSIMLGLRKSKKIVSIARLAKYEEHVDDHQLEILDVFSKSGAVLAWSGTGDLLEVIARVGNFVSAGYPFGEERISAAILDYLGGAVT
jgi:UDP-N-acetylglucosamine transferase subunit ALG13